MTETICVLALDAADYELLHRWNCDEILLDQHGELETFAWSKDDPYTPEVWSTVATGVSPADHGIGDSHEMRSWENPLLRAGSSVTKYLPSAMRQQIGRPFRELGFENQFETVRASTTHPFDASLSWPGIDEPTHLEQMWSLADDVAHGNRTKQSVEHDMKGLFGQEIGWLEAMNTTDSRVVGVHAHILDVAGHMHATNPTELRAYYEWVNEQVGKLRKRVEKLVILSDHGMETTACNDENPGTHAWRAMVSSQGITDELPESVYDVKEWLLRNRDRESQPDESITMDTPTQTLKDLGYIQ